MTKNAFNEICEMFTIAPNIALENEQVKLALKKAKELPTEVGRALVVVTISREF